MKVFLSWSGPQAQAMAEALSSWLKLMADTIEPFVSSQDIPKGDRGFTVIADHLEGTSCGIICVTRENSLAPWINFEAGALSKAVGESRVIPLLLDLTVSDITGPLKQFQAVSSNSRQDVYKMVDSIRGFSGLNLTDETLKTRFDMFWPGLESSLERARAIKSADGNLTPVRSVSEVLEEVLILTRRHEAILRTVIERVDSSAPMQEIRKDETAWSSATPAQSELDNLPSIFDKTLIDNLLAALAFLGDTALAYRITADRMPREVLVRFDAGSVTSANVNDVCQAIERYANSTSWAVVLKTKDGYFIVAQPGLPPNIILEPQLPPSPPEAAPDA
jgi:hypothetical protein